MPEHEEKTWIYVVQLDIPEEHEDTFNRLYDEDHVPALLAVPGVRSCKRYRLAWADSERMARYLTIYEVDDPEVPKSAAWRTASMSGEWPHLVRPHLTTRLHGMFHELAAGERTWP